ncbi:MAG: NAD(P)H-dependent oxidoreductase subunit E, partial [Thermoanaerobaculia bacterium]|nr:NAD(P)H-dependent oxidoreductase subunit E [Thermoanaerobaculia bacterium]
MAPGPHLTSRPLPGLVSELTLLQEREGWLSEDALRGLAERLRVPLHRLESVSTFYTHFRRRPPARHTLHVCRDLPCALAGSEAALVELRRRFAGEDVEIVETSCLGRCDAAPAACLGHRVLAAGDADAVAG